MKKFFYIFIALMICSLSCYADKNNKNAKIVIDNMLERVSVRQYSDKKIEQEKIDTILKAAMSAPSGMNRQR